MFKGIQSGLSKFFGKRWIAIAVIIVICFALISYSGSKDMVIDRMTTGDTDMTRPIMGPAMNDGTQHPGGIAPMTRSSPPSPGSYETHAVASPSDLLPSDPNSQWGDMNPVNQGNIALPDLLQAGHHIGLDTIGQTLKNANLQLRSDPIIEKTDVGPWNISTYEGDYARVPLELGGVAR
jgi:hypothetical protein